MTTLYRYRIYCTTESSFAYTWSDLVPTVCPNNNGHTIDTNLTSIIDTQSSLGEVTNDGELKVYAGEKNIFGDLKTSKTNVIFQNYYLYGVFNKQLSRAYSASGGSHSPNPNGCELDINITNALYSYSVVRCLKVIKYRPGISNIIRFNMLFDTPVANSLQFGGAGNSDADFYFCYNGTDFGIRYSTDGLAEVRTLTITAAETQSSTATIFLNGVEFTVSLTNASSDIYFTASQIAYQTTYTGWNVEAIRDTVIFQKKDVGPANGTYSFSSTGTAVASIAQTKGGSSLTTTFVSSSSWNGPSPMVTSLNPLKRNMYAIEYAWYGSGNVKFEVYNPDTSIYEIVHTLKFANSFIEPSNTAPNMFLQQGLASLGSTTAMSMTISGGYAANLGNSVLYSPIHTIYGEKSIAANTEKVLFALKNRNTYNGLTNQSELLFERLNFSTDGNKSVIIKIYKLPTSMASNITTDYLNFDYIEKDDSLGLVCVNCSTFTGGTLIDSLYLNKVDSQYINLNKNRMAVFQGEVYFVTAKSTNISDINYSITFINDY